MRAPTPAMLHMEPVEALRSLPEADLRALYGEPTYNWQLRVSATGMDGLALLRGAVAANPAARSVLAETSAWPLLERLLGADPQPTSHDAELLGDWELVVGVSWGTGALGYPQRQEGAGGDYRFGLGGGGVEGPHSRLPRRLREQAQADSRRMLAELIDTLYPSAPTSWPYAKEATS